jgi:hypothetical protein
MKILEWMIKRTPRETHEAKADAPAAKPHRSNKAGKYRLLYEYLENRYANNVVLTFGQIEDLLGFTLPDPARTDKEWWTIADINVAEARCSDAWTLAGRTATPNLSAQTVVFERLS